MAENIAAWLGDLERQRLPRSQLIEVICDYGDGEPIAYSFDRCGVNDPVRADVLTGHSRTSPRQAPQGLALPLNVEKLEKSSSQGIVAALADIVRLCP